MPSTGSRGTVASGRAASTASRRGCERARRDPRMAEPASPEAGITITRVFDAPRERVWKEWTEPERFADWYGGSDGEVPVSTVSMDVREGGAWRATMLYGGRKIQ